MKDKQLAGIIGYLLGTIFNIGFVIVTIVLVYNFAIKGFTMGKGYTDDSEDKTPYKEVEINIAEGATIDEVSGILEEKGIIKSALLFKLESVLKGSDDPFSGGTFQVNTKMDSNELNTTLRQGSLTNTDIKITIIEGFSVKNIGEYLEDLGVVTKEDFINACNNGDFRFDFLQDIPKRENRLEGYLFPDTYFIAKDSSSEDIINKLLARFEQIYSDEYAQRAKELDLTMDQVITIASIIEKEIKKGDERPKAASVIYNRLNTDMNLQMCSTILYVLDKRKDRLLDEDLNVESPYNTYLHTGLPLGPIANPGEDCIKAALYPEEGDLLYFVVKDEETGEHVFTNDYDAFVNAKAEFKQKY